MKRFVALAALAFVGCGVAAEKYTDREMVEYDKHTRYCTEDHSDGFTVFVWHERYQMFGNDAKISETGKQALQGIVLATANAKGKAVEMPQESAITSNIGRVDSGVTSWSAKARVYFKAIGTN